MDSGVSIVVTQDGSHSLYSDQFDEQYHSKYGAIQESNHVFIQHGLAQVLLSHTLPSIKILEIGFGTGLNALLSAIYHNEKSPSTEVHYEGLEAYPISLETALQINYPAQINAPIAEEIYNKIHTSPWKEYTEISSGFHINKREEKFEDAVYDSDFDLIYFDAFAPGTQAHLWEIPFFKKMYNALNEGGRLVTYSAKGSVKRNLKAVGFQVSSPPGPPGKREMTVAVK